MANSIDQEERRWQDAVGGSLQDDAYDRLGTREIHNWQFARIVDAAEVTGNMRVLDIGCGVGHLLIWIAQQSAATLHGLDISMNSLARARAQAPAINWSAASGEQLPYSDASFDRVLCNGSAHHIVDKQRAFNEMFRILKPSGRLILHEPAATVFSTAIRSVFVRSARYESPVDLALKEEFSASSAEVMLRRAGFTQFRHSQHDFLAYPLSGNYFRSPLSGSRALMQNLISVEKTLNRIPILASLLRVFSWRSMLVCEFPPASGQGVK